MGIRYQKRNRMESVRDIPDQVLASLGETDIRFENFDMDMVYHDINKRQDEIQARLDSQ